MGFILSRIFSLFTLTLVGVHAALPLPPELYWNSVLPNTPMPKTISELIQPDFITVGKGGVFVHNQVVDPAINGLFNWGDDSDESSMFGYNSDESLMFGYNSDESSMFGYKEDVGEIAKTYKDASENLTLEDPTRVLFFLETDIHPGKTMNYRLAGDSIRETFLSRRTAESIPFRSSKLAEILNQLSVKPGSLLADAMKDTIQYCERKVTRGEERYCATSLESMIDFAISKLGRNNIKPITTELEKGAAPLQNYTITPGVKKLAANKLIACHKLIYAYAVFYCHSIEQTRTYIVPLEGADGTKAKAVADCHVYTAGWSHRHLAFRELNVKPGTVPICHFLKDQNVAWVSN